MNLRPVLLVFLLALGSVASAQQPIESAEGPLLELEVRVLHVGSDGTTRPVPPNHRFAEGDQLVFELEASRGGYVRLAVEDPTAPEGLRSLWPATPNGQPVAARKASRLPALGEDPLRLVGKSPTPLVLLFSPRPSIGPPARKWLRQFEVRDVERGPTGPGGPPSLRFQGRVPDEGTGLLRVTLHHDARGRANG